MLYLVLGFFFVSGACGLVYEVVWSREFVLVLGGTTHAMTAVVVAFMGGLGLGGFLGGRFIDKSGRDPILVYGALEGAVGAMALLVPVLLDLLQPVLAAAYQGLGDAPFLYNLVRFVLSALLLFPPTVLMGATLPILVKATLTDRERFGLAAGRVYAVNTAGAVLGAALAGFVLLPALGNGKSILLAAGANFLICALVLLFRKRLPGTGAETIDAREDGAGRPPLSPRAIVVMVGYGLSGLAALVYQIAWTRSLTLTLGGSTYTFSLILTAFIGGLALGGMAITPFADRARRPLLWCGIMEIGIGLSAVLVLPFLDNVNLAMYRWMHEYQWGSLSLSAIKFGVVAGAVFVPTALMGALLPLLAKAMSRERPGAGEPMGLVYSSNTMGSVTGAFLAGFVLLDLIGVRATVMLATLLGVGIGALWLLSGELSKRSALAISLAALAIAAGALRLVPAPDPIVVNSGPYVYATKVMSSLPEGVSVDEYLHRTYVTRFFKEDAETTVSVLEERIDEWRVLRINGKTDASSSSGDMPNQVLLAQFPLLVHPNPKKVMVLGLASGVTAGSALLHPIARLDCLELSPAVVEASHYFKDVNNLDYGDPRFNLILNDGRNHLALGSEKYDVIISEPSNPWQAAMSSMFTREFFELMRGGLEPGGIALAWIDVYDMNDESFKLILRTFASVFPHVTLWESSPGGDYIMMGSMEPFRLDYERLEKKCLEPKVRADLLRIQDNPALGILARFVMDEEGVRHLAGEGELHTDDLRQLEFDMPRQAFSPYSERIPAIFELLLAEHMPATEIVGLPGGEEGRRIEKQIEAMDGFRDRYLRMELRRLRGELSGGDYIEASTSLIESLGGRYPSRELSNELADIFGVEATKSWSEGDEDKAAELFLLSHRLNPRSSRAASSLARLHFFGGDIKEARKWAEAALGRRPRDRHAMEVLARIANKEGDHALESALLARALEVYPDDFGNRVMLGRSLFFEGKLGEALSVLGAASEDRPGEADPYFFMGLIETQKGNKARARELFGKALEADPDHPSRKTMESMISGG